MLCHPTGRSSTTFRFVVSTCAVFLAACSTAVTSLAQNDSTERGFQPAATYALSDIETINTSNGNLLLNIPIVALPAGRGGELAPAVNLIYNSKIYEPVTRYEITVSGQGTRTSLQPNSDGGWNYGLTYWVEVQQKDQPGPGQPGGPPCTDPRSYCIWKTRVHFPDGSIHDLVPAGYEGSAYTNGDGYYSLLPDGRITQCIAGNISTAPFYGSDMTWYTTDGTYARVVFTHDADANYNNNQWSLSMPNGTRVTDNRTGTQTVRDRNGNLYQIVRTMPGGVPKDTITDQLNRTITLTRGTGSPRIDTITATGYSQAPSPSLAWTVRWTNVSLNKTYITSGDLPSQTYSAAVGIMVDQITLPSQTGGLSYGFAYKSGSTGWGELAQLTLPSGAAASYNYKYDNQNNLSADQVTDNSPSRKKLNYTLEYDGVQAPAPEEQWDYDIASNQNTRTISGPDGGTTTEYYSYGAQPMLAYRTDWPNGARVERLWSQNTPTSNPIVPGAINPQVTAQFTSVRDANNTLSATAIRTFTYDLDGNLTLQEDYDWVPYGSVPRDPSTQAPTGVPASATKICSTVNTYFGPQGGSGPRYYFEAGAPRLRNAIKATEVRRGNGTVISRSEMTYDDAYTTGNATLIRSWDSTKGALGAPPNQITVSNSISTTATYDTYGNPLTKTDPTGGQTEYVYGSIGGFVGLYPTQITRAKGTTFARVETRVYDLSSGAVTTSTDVNNNVATVTNYDVFGRQILVRSAAGLAEETRIRTEYSDPLRRVITRADLTAVDDGKIVSIQHYDQLGRVRLARRLEDATVQSAEDALSGVKVQTRYLYSNPGRDVFVSNPYRAATSTAAEAEPTMGWTRTHFNKVDKITEVRSFDGASLPAPLGNNARTTGAVTTSYDAQRTIVTDQAGKQRRNYYDPLHRLYQVDEPDASGALGPISLPKQKTEYTYDALSNLTGVSQAGLNQSSQPVTQTRSFTYSSLSRLLSVTTPETGQVVSTYYDDGNLLTRADSRVTITYTYDALKRILTENYSDSTPDITYSYDDAAVPYSKGKLTSVKWTANPTASESKFSAYDALGRVTSSLQKIDGTSFVMGYSYDRAGNLLNESYPSASQAAVNSYNPAGQLSSVSWKGTPVANNALYSPAGDLTQLQLKPNTSTPLLHRIDYNGRLQPVNIRLGTSASPDSILQLAYSYGVLSALNPSGTIDTTKNNGNAGRLLIVPGTGHPGFEQDFQYDSINRISGAAEFFTSGSPPPNIPSIDTLTPASHSADGTAFLLTIQGYSLAGADSVTFSPADGISVSNVLPGSDGTTVTCMVTIPTTATTGAHDVRVHTPAGYSNTLPFNVTSSGTLTAPSSLTATVVSSARVDLGWNDANGFEDGFRVYRKVSGAPTFTLIGTAGPTTTGTQSYSDGTCAPNTAYVYQVTAFSMVRGESAASNQVSVTTPAAQLGSTGNDTVGYYDPASHSWYLRNYNSTGPPFVSSTFDPNGSNPPDVLGTWVPLAGNWNGPLAPTDTIAYFDPSASKFYLNNDVRNDFATWQVQFGPTNSTYTPVAGDWNGDAFDSVGLFDPVTSTFFLTNSFRVTPAPTDYTVQFGPAGANWVPVCGDWDNNGTDTIGLFDPVASVFYLKNSLAPGIADVTVSYGPPNSGWTPVTGDWNGDGQDTLGLFDPASATWFLRDSLTPGVADYTFPYPQSVSAGIRPVVGDWDDEMASPSGALDAATPNWTETYTYDRWGNRLSPGPAVDQSTNKLSASAGFDTDGAGNLIQVPTGTANQYQFYVYDGANRITQVKTGITFASAAITATYTYDGNSRRVKTVVGSITTRFVYDATGRLIAEYTGSTPTLSKEYVYGPTGLLAVAEVGNPIKFLTTDILGSPRVSTKYDGTVAGRHDYSPYGQELSGNGREVANGYTGAADMVRNHFTGKERDPESGLDYFGARYYASGQCRFTSADQGAPDLIDPQSWNRYIYARNNPLYYTDPDGNSDKPAKSQRINAALATDPTLLEVIRASNNLSQEGFETALLYGGFNSRLNTGAGNIIRGLAGEAIVIDTLRRPVGPNNLPLAVTVLSQPANLSSLLTELTLPSDTMPDIGALHYSLSIKVPFTGKTIDFVVTLENVVANASGATRDLTLPTDIKFGLYEVKAGFTSLNYTRGAAQVAATAALLKGVNAPGVAILVLDKAVFERLTPEERSTLYNTVTAAGGYILLYDGLAAKAAARARQIIETARRFESGRFR